MLVSTIALTSWLLFVPAPDGWQAAPIAVTASDPATDDVEPASNEPVWLDPADAIGDRVPLHGPVTPQIVRLAETLLDLPMGTERALGMGARRYLFVLELHYHPPGFVGGPTGWHKGVTVYELR